MENGSCNLRIVWAGPACSQSMNQEHQSKHHGHPGRRLSSAPPARGGCAICLCTSQAGPELVAQAEDPPFPMAKMGLSPFAYLRLVELQQDGARGKAAVV